MNPRNTTLYSIMIRLALFILIASCIMFFFVKFGTAEFYILIVTAILMLLLVCISAFMLRKDKKNETK